MTALRSGLLVLYPVLVYAALQRVSSRTVSLALLAVVVLRALTGERRRAVAYARAAALPALTLATVLGITAVWNRPGLLLAAPSLGSFALLVVFGRSLARDESFVEALARAQLGTLTEEERSYCRRVTLAWCCFFLLNGSVALVLACWGTLEAWTLYTGGVAYLGIAALFSIEFVYRQWRFRRYIGAPSDAFFRRVFPPRAE